MVSNSGLTWRQERALSALLASIPLEDSTSWISLHAMTHANQRSQLRKHVKLDKSYGTTLASLARKGLVISSDSAHKYTQVLLWKLTPEGYKMAKHIRECGILR